MEIPRRLNARSRRGCTEFGAKSRAHAKNWVQLSIPPLDGYLASLDALRAASDLSWISVQGLNAPIRPKCGL